MINVENKAGFSEGLIQEAVGSFVNLATKEGVEANIDNRQVPFMSFSEIDYKLQRFGVDTQKTPDQFKISGGELNILETTTDYLDIAGARILACIEKNGKKVILPGVALPRLSVDEPLKFELLATMVDRINPATDGIKKPLTDLQQQLIDSALAQNLSGVGVEHGKNGVINAGEIGHGALIASSASSTRIHAKTHLFGEARKIATSVSQEMTIYTDKGPRPTGTTQLTLGQISELYINANHQPEFKQELNAFELGAGLVLAAVGTRPKNLRIDTASNLGGILLPQNGVSNGH